jgi:lipopolysaccharide export system permease protein
MLLQYVAKKFGDLVGKGLPARVITEFLALSIPFTVAMTLPMAVLVAVLYAFSRLAAENEITAMKASGIGMRSVLVPVLLGGFGLSLVMMAFNDQVLPRSNHRLAVLTMDIFRTKPTFALRDQVINTIKEGQLYLRAGHINERTSWMKDVVIYDLSDPMHRRTIYADSGTLALAPNRTDLDMTLYHGYMQEVPNKEPGQLTRLFYRRERLRVANVMNVYQESKAGSVSKGDREMSVCEMQAELARADYSMRMARYDAQVAAAVRAGRAKPRPPAPNPRGPGIGRVYCSLFEWLAPKTARAQASPRSRAYNPAAGLPPGTITPGGVAPGSAGSRHFNTGEARAFDAQIQDANSRAYDALRERNTYDVEIQKKFSLSAACVIFVLIGAPIALRFPRGGVGLVIGVSFAIFGLYYVGLIGGEALADKAYLPPWLAMWAVNILLLVAGLILAARMGRESATSRGGDFGELLITVRARLLGWLRPIGIRVERRRA